MATNTKSTLDEILLEQGLDHILNSPDEEFVKFAQEQHLDITELKTLNKSAALSILKVHENTQSNNAVLHRPSKILNNREQSLSYLERLIKSAKSLGFSIDSKDLESLNEESLQLQIAHFQSLLDRHGRRNKRRKL
ncbi:MAG: hypothetical protein PHF58_09380 [Methylotenera sp.]|jgi:spore germination protein YaaH|nr:hypothetical protein [Methylotenera sp.]